MDDDASLVLQRILSELQLLRQQQTQTDEHMCWVKAKLETLESVLCDAPKPAAQVRCLFSAVIVQAPAWKRCPVAEPVHDDGQERRDLPQPSQTHTHTHTQQGPATGGGFISADWTGDRTSASRKPWMRPAHPQTWLFPGPGAMQDTPPQQEDGIFSMSGAHSSSSAAAPSEGASTRRRYTAPSWEADHDEHGDTMHSLKAANERAPLLAGDSLAYKVTRIQRGADRRLH
jgi:hypothetical protein